MNNDSIQSGLPQTTGPAPIIGDGWVQLGGPGSKKIFWDQLSQADQSEVLQYIYLLSAQIPVLVPPQQVVMAQETSAKVEGLSPTAIAVMTEQTKNEIIMTMLDGWIKNIQEIADQSKKDSEKKRIEDLSIAFNAYQHQMELQSQTDPNFPLFTVGLIIVGTGMMQAILPNKVDPATTQVGVNPVISMYNHMIAPIQSDMRAELGMIGAIFASGVVYFSMAQAASKTVGTTEQPKGGEFAKGYAQNMIALVDSPSFNSYIMAIVTQRTQAAPLSDEELRNQVAIIKVILLSSALAMMYQVEAGKMIGEEFADMISRNGTIKFDPSSIQANLVNMIQAHLNSILPPKTREKLIAGLLEYFETEPSIDELSNPDKVLEGFSAILHRGDLAG